MAYSPPLFVIALLSIIPFVNGLLKLPPNFELVSNPRDDVVYLFQFPRTSHSPSQAALNLKVETWLKWKEIPFHRLSNQFFLGAPSTGTGPFAFYKGRFVDGSDAIIEQIGAELGDYDSVVERFPEEKEMRGLIDDVLFKILMFDRNKSLAWMLTDEGIVQQMGPILGIDRTQSTTLGSLGTFSIHLNFASLSAFFDAYNHREKRKEFVKSHLKRDGEGGQGQDEPDPEGLFNEFSKWVREKVLRPGMETVLMDMVDGKPNTRNAGNSMAKLKELLKVNILDLDKYKGVLEEELKIKGGIVDEVNGKHYLELTDGQLAKLLDTILDKIGQRLKHNGGQQLFKLGQTPADASLFGVLVQFFETRLNYGDTIGKQFQETGGILHQYIQKVKASLGLEGVKWARLTKYPWTMNYDCKYSPENEEFIPFNVRSGEFEIPNVTIEENGNVQLNEQKLANKYPEGQLEAINGLIQTVNGLKLKDTSLPASPKHHHHRGSGNADKGTIAREFLGMMGEYICRVGGGGADECREKLRAQRGDEEDGMTKLGESQLEQILEGMTGKKTKTVPRDHRGKAELIEHIRDAVRARVFAELVAYKERATAANVLAAVRQVNDAIAKATPAEAAELVSRVVIGNEL